MQAAKIYLELELPNPRQEVYYWMQKSLLMDDKIPPLVAFAEGLLYSFVGDYFTLYDVSQVLFSVEFVMFELKKGENHHGC